MHKLTLAVVGLALSLVGASAQERDEPSIQRQLEIDPASPSGSLRSQAIVIVDVSSLPQAKQVQIHRGVAERGEGELQKLRLAIDAAPGIVAALNRKQLLSIHVLSAEISPHGRLTLLIMTR